MRTYKYKLLSAKRNKKLHRQINAGALAWNHCVAFTRRFYRFYRKSVSENALKKHLTKLKKRVPYGYLRDMGSQALQDVVERLYRSYKRFFDAKKNGEKCGLPSFKKVRKYKSFTLSAPVRRQTHRWVKVPPWQSPASSRYLILESKP